MSLVLLAARLALAGVFALAALTKLRDVEGSRRAVADFGVPRRLAWLLGTLLPLVELATAGMLVPHVSAKWGALAACALLLAFSVGIGANLLRGRTPECRCFGQVHSAPISWGIVARNLALALGAVAIVANQAPLAVAAFVLLVAAFRGRRVDVQTEGLAVGTKAPEFEAMSGLLARGRPVLLVFGSQHCGPCAELAPELDRWRREHEGRLTIETLDREDSEQLFEAYRIEGTPTAVLVGADGRIASAAAPGENAIRRLVASDLEGHRLQRRDFLVRLGSVFAVSAPVLAMPSQALAALRREAGAPSCESQGAVPIDCRDGRCCHGTRFTTRCGNCCVNVFADPRNCDGCGKKCKAGEVCAGRRCVSSQGRRCDDLCSPREICCDGQCVDPRSATTDCGGCNRKCTEPGYRCCDGICRDTKRDPDHCGFCGKRCPEGRPICFGGKCVEKCPGDLKFCRKKLNQPYGTCYQPKGGREECCRGRVLDQEDKQNDRFNCGECGNECGKVPIIRPLLDGAAATLGWQCCGGKCQNVGALGNNDHCTKCFDKCKKGEICRPGSGCVCPLGAKC